MYYFERGRCGIPVFWKENGLPLFMGGRRISKRGIVWWMPTNWAAVPLLVIISLPRLALVAVTAIRRPPR